MLKVESVRKLVEFLNELIIELETGRAVTVEYQGKDGDWYPKDQTPGMNFYTNSNYRIVKTPRRFKVGIFSDNSIGVRKESDEFIATPKEIILVEEVIQ